MITIHDEIKQGTPEWLAAREDKFTGSNWYKLLGFRGATEDSKSTNDGFQGNFWTHRAHILEKETIELYEAITGDPVASCGFIENDKYPNCLYSPDGLPPVALLEVKNFDIPHHLKLINGDIPLPIQAQIKFGLLMSERPYGHLVPYSPILAKKRVNGKLNPLYDPSKAFKIITIKTNRAERDNFKRILQNYRSNTFSY